MVWVSGVNGQASRLKLTTFRSTEMVPLDLRGSDTVSPLRAVMGNGVPLSKLTTSGGGFAFAEDPTVSGALRVDIPGLNADAFLAT